MRRIFRLCVFFISVVLSGQAVAASYTYTISPAAFLPNYDTYQYYCNGNLLAVTSGGLGYFTAPAFLPTGAEITGVKVVFLDNDSSAHVEINFFQNTLDGTTTNQLHYYDSGSSFADSETQYVQGNFTEPYPVVDNDNYLYFVQVRLSEDHAGTCRLYAYQSHYTLDTQRNVVVIPMGQ